MTARVADAAAQAPGAGAAGGSPAALVVNPRAGTLARSGASRADLAAALERAGHALVPASAGEDAAIEEQWACALAAAPAVVFVAGGDGTLRDAARRLLGTGIALAPLPGGTMNRLCHRLGLPADPLAAAEAYRDAQVAQLPVGFAGGEPFLYQCVVGPPARLIRLREGQRGDGLLGWWPLLRGLLRALRRPLRPDLVLRLGGRRRRGVAAVITVPQPGAAPALRVELTRPRGLLGRLRQAWRWFAGRLAEDGQVLACEMPQLAIGARTPLLRASLDGEPCLLPRGLRLRLAPRALPVLRPKDA